MKLLFANILLILTVTNIHSHGFQLNSNDAIYDSKYPENNNFLNKETKFESSLKKFLKKNEDEEELSIEHDKEFIRKQVLSELYSKFIIDVVNNSTVSFLDNLNSEKSDKNEFQIELEESCSPFFCEKVMKAKEIENSPNEQKDENSDTLIDNLNNNEKEIKFHNENENDIIQNLNSINNDDNSLNEKKEIDAFFSESFDGNKQQQKIVLTDGDNVYVLEEIIQNENELNNDDKLNKKIDEKEIKMHVPSEIEEKQLFEDMGVSDIFEQNEELNNLQKDEEKGIREHNSEDNNTNENNNDDNIFELNENELSKKIFDEIKMNNEEKVECYNFSKNEDKCNSFKKCTFVNIDNKDTCFLDYNYMLFLKNNNCALQSKASLLSISKDLLENEIINRQLFQLLRNSNNNNFICDTITYSFLTNVVDNTDYEEIFS